MDAGLVVAIVLAVAFALTNGSHDAASSIAALVATARGIVIDVSERVVHAAVKQR
jgi:hypothetical protein